MESNWVFDIGIRVEILCRPNKCVTQVTKGHGNVLEKNTEYAQLDLDPSGTLTILYQHWGVY